MQTALLRLTSFLLGCAGNGLAPAPYPSQHPACTSPSGRCLPTDPQDLGDPAPVRSTLNTPGLWARQHHLEQLNLTQGLWVPTFSGTIKGCVSSLGKRSPVLAKSTAQMSQYFLLWLKLKVGYSSCLHGNLLWICIPSTKLFLDLSMISDPGVNIH